MTWPVDAKRLARRLYWQRAWSLVPGCTPVSPGCDHCWSAAAAYMRQNHPNAKVAAANAGLTDACGRFNGTVRPDEVALAKPTPRQRPAVWSVWNDLFHEQVPSGFIGRAFRRMAECPQHVFLVCTKRAGRMADEVRKIRPLPNVVLMVTAENQEYADLRVPHLLRCEGWTKGLSCEPLLGAVDLSRWLDPVGQESCPNCGANETTYLSDAETEAIPTDEDGDSYCLDCGAPRVINGFGLGLDWVICGGESGAKARPMHPDWARSLRDQCKQAQVPFFFKQWGPRGAGHLLDGKLHQEFPKRRAKG